MPQALNRSFKSGTKGVYAFAATNTEIMRRDDLLNQLPLRRLLGYSAEEHSRRLEIGDPTPLSYTIQVL
jgi:hypothetical protein